MEGLREAAATAGPAAVDLFSSVASKLRVLEGVARSMASELQVLPDDLQLRSHVLLQRIHAAAVSLPQLVARCRTPRSSWSSTSSGATRRTRSSG